MALSYLGYIDVPSMAEKLLNKYWRALARRCKKRLEMQFQVARMWSHSESTIDNTVPRVFYGYETIPSKKEMLTGGLVKCQDLVGDNPNTLQNPNIIYLVSSSLPIYPHVLISYAKKNGAKIIVNQNGVAYQAWLGRGWQKLNRHLARVLHSADYVFYQSHFCKKASDLFLGKTDKPWEILHNAVDTIIYHPVPKDERNFYVLSAGSHGHRYRTKVTLKAFAALHSKLKKTRLLLAGSFNWHNDQTAARKLIIDWCDELNIKDKVEVIRKYTQEMALRLFERAHILLHPTCMDSCPRLVVEAMAAGLPVAHTNSGGVPELVGNAGIGVEVDADWKNINPPDPKCLSQAMFEIYQNYSTYSKNAQTRAVDHFDIRNWLKRHEDVFDSLVVKN